MEQSNKVIEDVLTAQVLTLAHLMKAQKESKGSWSTSDFTYEAVRLIREKQPEILRLVRENLQR